MVNGYKLPQGTIVIPQISAVLADERIFENPCEFDPTRFLDKEGKFVNIPELIPFSIGKRTCLGEGLARLQLFLTTVILLQHFEFSSPPGELPSLEPVYSFVLCPKPYKVRVKIIK